MSVEHNSNVENLVLEQLRLLRSELAGLRAEVRSGLTAVEHRLGRVETGIGDVHGDYAALSVRIDQIQADMRLLKSRYETVG
jgi:hypothetical protein